MRGSRAKAIRRVAERVATPQKMSDPPEYRFNGVAFVKLGVHGYYRFLKKRWTRKGRLA